MLNILNNILVTLLPAFQRIGFIDSGFEAPSSASNSGLSFITDQLYDLLMNVALQVADTLIVAIVIPFLGLFIILEIFWDIIRQRIKDDGAQNFTLRQPIILILLILVSVSYIDIAKGFDSISNAAINQATELINRTNVSGVEISSKNTTRVMSRFSAFDDLSPAERAVPLDQTEKMFEDKIKTAEKVKEGEGSEQETAEITESLFKLAGNDLSTQVESVVYTIIYWTSRVIRMCIEGIAFILTMLLIALGPLAILSYAIPGDIGKQALTQTVGSFFQFKMWLIIIGVLDALLILTYNGFYVQRIANSANPSHQYNVGDNFMGTILILAFGVMYLAVPKITTIILSRGDASGLRTAAVSSAKSGFNAVKTIASGGASGMKSLTAKTKGK